MSRQLLEEEVRDSISKLYNLHWNNFKGFGSEAGVEATAAGPLVVVDFLANLANSSQSKSSSLMARAAISYHLSLEAPMAGDPTNHVSVAKVMKKIVKKYGKPGKKALQSQIDRF